MSNVDINKIINRLEQLSEIKIAVFGDFCLDKYLYSDPKRNEMSVETGLVARQFHRKKTAAGVGGTITNNLRSLGVDVICVGSTGDDGEGWELRRELEKIGANTELLGTSADMCTPSYVKPMMKNDDGSYTEWERIDFRNFTPITRDTEDKVLANLKTAFNKADAIVAVDQYYQRNTGIITDYVRDRFMKLAEESGKPVLTDSRAFIYEFTGTMIKCNNLELIEYFNNNEGNPTDLNTLIECSKRLFDKNGHPLFITRGSEGMLVYDENGATNVPAFKVEGPLDITGAGDASSAGIGTGCALGLSYAEAATLACCISSITIQQVGCTGTATVEQVIERLKTRV